MREKLKSLSKTMKSNGTLIHRSVKRWSFPAVALVIITTLLLPVLVVRNASAAGQLSARSLSISSGVPSKTGVQYKLTFTVVATSTLQSMKFQACTTAVGTCTAAPGLSFSSATFVSQNNFQGGTNFAVDNTGGGDCTPAANILCSNRTDATNQTATSRDITFGTITNPSSANVAFFVRISTYSDNAYTLANIQDYGVTASAVVQTLTTNAAVAEVLNFCVGTTTGDAGTATTVIPADCTAISGTSLNIGVLTNTQVNVSPVAAVNGGDGLNGLVMLRTNATSGATIGYDAIQAPSGTNHLGTLRITGSNCNAGTVATDPCINAAGTTQTTLTSGTENFGMTIAATNCESTTSYSCTFAGGTYNLVRAADYDGTGSNTYPTDTDVVAGTTNAGYAWDETGTIANIANSSTYVDDEALILKFAGTSSITTPFGSYSVATDFIAVPTY
jgi:hypothetical protein